MDSRGDRRDRTFHYARRTLRAVQIVHAACHVAYPAKADCRCRRPLGYYFKDDVGCRCQRRSGGAGPKVTSSTCYGGRTYHPCVVDRIRGKRLCQAWIRTVGMLDPADVEL